MHHQIETLTEEELAELVRLEADWLLSQLEDDDAELG